MVLTTSVVAPICAQKLVKNYTHQVATSWMTMSYDLTKHCPKFYPPVAARAFAYEGITLYQALLPGMSDCISMNGQVNELKITDEYEKNEQFAWGIVANTALANITKHLYSNMSDSMMALVLKLEKDNYSKFSKNESKYILNKSVARGNKIANSIWEWSKGDGGHESFLTDNSVLIKPNKESDWVPTLPKYSAPILSKWGLNRSFVPKCTENSQPTGISVPYSTDHYDAFYAQANEVYKSVKYIKPEQKVIAQYWSDDAGLPGTPPGHSISIAIQLIEKEKLNLAQVAELYAKLGMALSDGFVSCWKTKYDFTLMRPITYINMNIDKDWTPILNTPPFPEFTSGHSVQSGATAQILISFFGNNYAFEDRTHANRKDINGKPRKYSSFQMFAYEAAISRLYGGIHYREAIESGIKQGTKVGNQVLALNWRKTSKN
jgi:PAP2 superfamily